MEASALLPVFNAKTMRSAWGANTAYLCLGKKPEGNCISKKESLAPHMLGNPGQLAGDIWPFYQRQKPENKLLC